MKFTGLRAKLSFQTVLKWRKHPEMLYSSNSFCFLLQRKVKDGSMEKTKDIQACIYIIYYLYNLEFEFDLFAVRKEFFLCLSLVEIWEEFCFLWQYDIASSRGIFFLQMHLELPSALVMYLSSPALPLWHIPILFILLLNKCRGYRQSLCSLWYM